MKTEEKDYYEVLEVSPNASDEIIKAAYKNLIKKYHPDNTGNIKDDEKIIEIKEAYDVLSDPKRRKEYDEFIKERTIYSANNKSIRNTRDSNNKSGKRKRVFLGIIILCVLIWGVNNIHFGKEKMEIATEVKAMISVQRTGNILTNIGELEVLIDDEKVFVVDGNSTNSITTMMPVGIHTIQTKGQGDKSKKIKFEVTENGENNFYFSAEISNWYGVKMEKRNYIPES